MGFVRDCARPYSFFPGAVLAVVVSWTVLAHADETAAVFRAGAATFNISLANGSRGYLPTPAQHALGGYETWLGANFVEVDASEKIETTLLELLAGLRERTPAE